MRRFLHLSSIPMLLITLLLLAHFSPISAQTSNNYLYLNGNVGIGTATPVSQLTLGGASDLVFTQNGYGITWSTNNGSPKIYGTYGGSLSFKAGNGSSTDVIDPNGNLGIGTTAPSRKTEIDGHLLIINNYSAANGWNTADWSSGVEIKGQGASSMASESCCNGAQLSLTGQGSVNPDTVAISFHRPGIYGAMFGLDTDNQFSTSGWSAGGGYTGLKTGTINAYGDIRANNAWLRTTGNAGWYSDSYGGGMYMTDGTWIRQYPEDNAHHMYFAGGFDTGNASGIGCGGGLGGGYTLRVCGSQQVSGSIASGNITSTGAISASGDITTSSGIGRTADRTREYIVNLSVSCCNQGVALVGGFGSGTWYLINLMVTDCGGTDVGHIIVESRADTNWKNYYPTSDISANYSNGPTPWGWDPRVFTDAGGTLYARNTVLGCADFIGTVVAY